MNWVVALALFREELIMSDNQIEIDDDRFKAIQCPDCEELSIRLDVEPNVCAACGMIFNPSVVFSDDGGGENEPPWDEDGNEGDSEFEHRGKDRNLHNETY